MPFPGIQYVIAAARLFLIGSVVYAAYQTNAQSNPLVTGLLVAVWGPEAGQALSSDSMSSIAPEQGMCVAFMAVVQTSLILELSHSSDLAYIWCAPVACIFLLLLLLDDQQPTEATKTQHYTRASTGLLTFLILGVGVGDLLLFGLSDSVLITLCIAQFSTSILLVVLLRQYGEPLALVAWKGGSLLVLAWAYLQICVAPLLSPEHAALRVGFALSVVINSALGVEGGSAPIQTRTQRFARGIVKVGSSIKSLLELVLTSPLAFEWMAIIGISLLTVSMNSAWWTSQVLFPDAIQTICNDALNIVGDVVQPVYEFTDDKDVQRVMAVALPELAGLRSAIYRLLVPIWGSLLDGANGKTFTLFPVGSFFCMAAFLVGPVLTMMGLLAKVFPEGRVFSQSQWFWAAVTLGNLVFGVFTQVTPDTTVFFVSSVLDGSKYTRTYTRDGVQALIAQSVVLGACVVLYVQTAVAAVIARSSSGTGSDADALQESPKHRPNIIRRCCTSVYGLLNYASSASLVLFAAGIMVLFLTATSSGSPISGISFDKRPTRQPDWLISTTLDKASALTVSIVRMLSPQRRLALLAVAIVQYGLEKINCWGCLCVPDVVGGAESAIDAVRSIFRRRRMLLEFSPADPVTFGPKRRLLAGQTCNPVSCPRGLVRLCIMDVIADGLEKLTDLSLGAVDVVFDFLMTEIFSQIPILSVATGFLKLLPRVDIYRDLDIFSKIKFSLNVKILGSNYGILPSVSIPSLPSSSGVLWGALPLLVIVVLALLLARQLGIEKTAWTVVTASFQIMLVSSFLTVLIAILALAYFLINEAKIQGYDVHLQPAPNLWLYAVGLALLALSLMIKIGEESNTRVQMTRRGKTGGRKGHRFTHVVDHV